MKQSDLLLLAGAGLAAVLLSKKTRAAPASPAPAPGRWDVTVGPVVLDENPSATPPTAAPGAPPAPPLPYELSRVGGSYQLEQGARYRARVELSGMEALLGSSSAVAERFARVGFGEITCQSLGGDAYQLEGTWHGPSGAYPAPAQITRVWRIG